MQKNPNKQGKFANNGFFAFQLLFASMCKKAFVFHSKFYFHLFMC